LQTRPGEARRFQRRDRLLTPTDFSSVFDENHFRSSHKHALLLARNGEENHSRLGLVVSKKNARLAVDRNRIKRVVRERFRLQRALFSGLDVVVMARAGLDKLANPEIASLFDQLTLSVQRQRIKKEKT
jgi:ribonuclease P protein component